MELLLAFRINFLIPHCIFTYFAGCYCMQMRGLIVFKQSNQIGKNKGVTRNCGKARIIAKILYHLCKK